MAGQTTRRKSPDSRHSSSGQRAPLRIVPMHPAPQTAAASSPHLTYRSGPLLTNVEVFTVFWGTAWQETSNSSLMATVNQFFDFILTSTLLDQLAEYSVPGKAMGHGKRIGTINFAATEPGKSTTDAKVQLLLKTEIASGTFPASNESSLYFVFLPPDTQIEQGGSKSCQTFCGYHDATSDKIFYAVMPYPGCTGCAGGLSVPDALTSTTSHELCEAITDPVPGSGWYDDANGEIGDICAWKTKTLGGFTVQLEWSNQAKSCI